MLVLVVSRTSWTLQRRRFLLNIEKTRLHLSLNDSQLVYESNLLYAIIQIGNSEKTAFLDLNRGFLI